MGSALRLIERIRIDQRTVLGFERLLTSLAIDEDGDERRSNGKERAMEREQLDDKERTEKAAMMRTDGRLPRPSVAKGLDASSAASIGRENVEDEGGLHLRNESEALMAVAMHSIVPRWHLDESQTTMLTSGRKNTCSNRLNGLPAPSMSRQKQRLIFAKLYDTHETGVLSSQI
jgi:hypothetical protein